MTEEWKSRIEDILTNVQSEIKEIKRYLDFPNDIGPADHIQQHILFKIKNKRTADLVLTIIKAVVWIAVAAVGTLVAFGIRGWLLT